MEYITNGRLYNSDIVICVASCSNGCESIGFHNIDEEIYIKKTGECFFDGSGGAMTEYAEQDVAGVEGENHSIHRR